MGELGDAVHDHRARVLRLEEILCPVHAGGAVTGYEHDRGAAGAVLLHEEGAAADIDEALPVVGPDPALLGGRGLRLREHGHSSRKGGTCGGGCCEEATTRQMRSQIRELLSGRHHDSPFRCVARQLMTVHARGFEAFVVRDCRVRRCRPTISHPEAGGVPYAGFERPLVRGQGSQGVPGFGGADALNHLPDRFDHELGLILVDVVAAVGRNGEAGIRDKGGQVLVCLRADPFKFRAREPL